MNISRLARIGPMTTDHHLIDRWETHLRARGLAERTIKLRRYYLTRLARVHPLKSCTTDVLEALLTDGDYAAETMKSIRSSWRDFYAWAHKHGFIDHDPASDLLPVRIPATVPHLAPDSEIAKAIRRAPLRERGMLQLARLACLRLMEITTLDTSCRAGPWLHVTGKGSKQRRVFLHPDLEATLRELEREQGSGWYFPGMYGHMHPHSVYRIMVTACGHNPHSLRHAGATAAYRATRDLRSVQAMLGHSSMAVTQRYLHVNDDGLMSVGLSLGIAA